MSENFVRLAVIGATQGCASALDIGSGSGKYRPPVPYWITLDAGRGRPLSDHHLAGDLLEILPNVDARSVDLVYALDVIEHLERDDGLVLLWHMERIARRRVLLFTPNGFMPLVDPNPWMNHRSGWTPDDFRERGYATAVLDFDYGPGMGKANALWAVRDVPSA